MKIANTFPPNYIKIAKTFKIKGRAGIIFTYGDTIFNPSRINIPPDLIAHEEVHQRQQRQIGGPQIWWEKYLENPEFRLQQEMAAYVAQYEFAAANYNRDQRRKLLKHISKALAGPMYGNLMSATEAEAAILARART